MRNCASRRSSPTIPATMMRCSRWLPPKLNSESRRMSEKYLNEVLKRSPANLRSNMALALLKVAHQDLAGAEQILKGAIQQAPKSDDAVVALATLYIGMGRFPEAEPLLTKAIQLNPDNTDAWISLGSVQLKSRQEGARGTVFQTCRRIAQDQSSFGLRRFSHTPGSASSSDCLPRANVCGQCERPRRA